MTTLKIMIPMAGLGKRLLPLTQRRPKPLMRITDKRLLDHVLDSLQELGTRYTLEYIFIVGYLGEQIRAHMQEAHPDKKVTYYVQHELKGQSPAVHLAKDALAGPLLLTYCDTINMIDYSSVPLDAMQGVAWVLEIEDPRRHGVALVGSDDLITKLVEKPRTMENKLALTGIYYFSEGNDLITAIETQMERGISLNNEYYLADAINILIENGVRVKAEKVLKWLDAGVPEDILATSAHLLQHHSPPHDGATGRRSNVLVPPVYIHESSRVENSIIGPNVSIGINCTIRNSRIKNSIIDDNSTLTEANLEDSLIGKGCFVSGKPLRSVIGDEEVVIHGGRNEANPDYS
jgi:glucose-1-phosphate thymidylyltransferase